jgi:hypothetical protein
MDKIIANVKTLLERSDPSIQVVDSLSTPSPGIVSLDRLESGLILRFSDGSQALYPNAMLFASLPLAIRLGEHYENE